MSDTAGTADTSQEWLSEHHAPATLATAPGATLASPPDWFRNFLNGNPGGEPGPVVNEHTALNYAALYSCVSLIAGTVASLPLKVYRRRADGGQDEAVERYEYDRLQYEFNPNTSAMTGRETGLGHLLTWGNSYCQIVRNLLPSRDVIRLQPLGPDIVCPETNDKGELVYDVYDRATGKVVETLRRDEMLHVPGLSFDAMCGYSTVRIAKSILRSGLAQDREAERFITRGIRPPGAIKMPAGKKFADEKQAIKFRDSFRRIHSQEDSSLNIIILEDGTEWQDIGFDPESAQLLESRNFSAEQICGIYRVPPHMIGLISKSTSWGTGIEEQTIGFVVYALLPILRRIEQEYNRKLFRGDKSLYCEHVLSGLLRGDHLKRSQALQIMAQYGIITVNEWRRLEGMNPVPGGNVRYFPLNMGRTDEDGKDIPALAATSVQGPAGPPGKNGIDGAAGSQGQRGERGDDGVTGLQGDPGAIGPIGPMGLQGDSGLKGDVGPTGPEGPTGRPGPAAPSVAVVGNTKLANSLRKAIHSAAGRCLRKEAAEAVKAAKKPETFVAWIDSFYVKHSEMLSEALDPLVEAWSEAFGACRYTAKHHASQSKSELLTAAECKADELVAAVEKVTERWSLDRFAWLATELRTGEAVSTCQ